MLTYYGPRLEKGWKTLHDLQCWEFFYMIRRDKWKSKLS